MARYIKRPRPEPTDEEFLALLILIGPFAWVARWVWRSWTTRSVRCAPYSRPG